MHVAAFACIHNVTIAILDERAPSTRLATFLPTAQDANPVMREWETEIVPLLTQQLEPRRLLLLHWTMNRQHYEPVMVDSHRWRSGHDASRSSVEGDLDQTQSRILTKESTRQYGNGATSKRLHDPG